MPRHTTRDQAIRKLSKVGSGKSYSITIPIALVRALKWKEHQKLVVMQNGRHLEIRDYKP